MQAIANRKPGNFRGALADTLEQLGERFDSEIQGAKREQSEKLNQAIRHLRKAENEAAWGAALADGAAGFCGRCALLAVEHGKLRLIAARSLPELDFPKGMALSEAPAFQSAVESNEPVVALRSERELPPALMHVPAGETTSTFHLFPVMADGQVAAVLYSDGESSPGYGAAETTALEALTEVAGAVLDSARLRWKKAAGFVEIASASKEEPAPAPKPRQKLAWDDLSREDREQHLRAQRLARVRVAEIRLYHEDAVRQGRANSNLYGVLKSQIDSGRDAFRTDFLTHKDSMVDYFHLELVIRLANDDEGLLGPDYPGPMV